MYEWLADFPLLEKLQKFVTANSVRFVKVSFDGIKHSGEGSVENPVVQRIKHISGEARNKGCSVDYSSFAKAFLCSTVNCRVNLIYQLFSSLNYSAFNASEVKVRGLGVKDSDL
jgi:hypothetical protein